MQFTLSQVGYHSRDFCDAVTKACFGLVLLQEVEAPI
jgi:hypothetical protein